MSLILPALHAAAGMQWPRFRAVLASHSIRRTFGADFRWARGAILDVVFRYRASPLLATAGFLEVDAHTTAIRRLTHRVELVAGAGGGTVVLALRSGKNAASRTTGSVRAAAASVAGTGAAARTARFDGSATTASVTPARCGAAGVATRRIATASSGGRGLVTTATGTRCLAAATPGVSAAPGRGCVAGTCVVVGATRAAAQSQRECGRREHPEAAAFASATQLHLPAPVQFPEQHSASTVQSSPAPSKVQPPPSGSLSSNCTSLNSQAASENSAVLCS